MALSGGCTRAGGDAGEVQNPGDVDAAISKQASELLQSADAARRAGDHGLALKLVRDGLRVIGPSYADERVIDDTGMRLVLCDVEENKGNVEGAFKFCRTVLQSRLSMLRYKAGSARSR
jgi:hypothetical protein